jgi:hypothetical protein
MRASGVHGLFDFWLSSGLRFSAFSTMQTLEHLAQVTFKEQMRTRFGTNRTNESKWRTPPIRSGAAFYLPGLRSARRGFGTNFRCAVG